MTQIGAGEPADADKIADRPARDAVAEGTHPADHLVPGDDRERPRRQITLDQLKIGSAHSARGDVDHDLARAGLQRSSFGQAQRTVGPDRSRLAQLLHLHAITVPQHSPGRYSRSTDRPITIWRTTITRQPSSPT